MTMLGPHAIDVMDLLDSGRVYTITEDSDSKLPIEVLVEQYENAETAYQSKDMAATTIIVNDERQPAFLPSEYLLNSLISIAWGLKGQEILSIAEDRLKNATSPSEINQALDRLADDADVLYSTVFLGTIEDTARRVLSATIGRGASVTASDVAVMSVPNFPQILEGMTNLIAENMKSYFRRYILPGLYEQIDVSTSLGITPDRDVFTELREAIARSAKATQPQWRTIANLSASRAYHYGVIKGGRSLGYRGYRWISEIDRRTTDTCRMLNGREFDLLPAERLVDRLASADMGEASDIYPFPYEIEEQGGLSASEVRSNAPILPPRHFNCRSTIALLII